MIGIFNKYIKKTRGLLCLILICISCNENSRDKEGNPTEMLFRIIITSPYSCYNEITLDKSYRGISVYGLPQYNDTLKELAYFNVNPTNEKDEIKMLIKKIDNEYKSIGKPQFAHDGYRYTLIADNKTLIDTYEDNTALYKILKILLPYIKVDKNRDCNFFYLLGRNIDSASGQICN